MYPHALAAGRDAERAREFLAVSLTGVAPPNIAATIPRMVSEASPFGELAYDYALANWEALAKLAGTNGRVWLLPGAASNFNEAARAGRLIADQRRVAGPDGASPAARTAARIELLSAVRERDAASLEKQLASWRPAADRRVPPSAAAR